jgi:tryptophan-rich sensory protein
MTTRGAITEIKTAAATSAAAATTALLGSIASSDVKTSWYRELDKPGFQPPGRVFGPVWSILYADIAVTSALALDGEDEENGARRRYQKALAINLVLNGSWSWMFFKFHRLLPSALLAGALAASSVDLTRRTWQARRAAGIALLPYPAWCSFATILSGTIWWRNRNR